MRNLYGSWGGAVWVLALMLSGSLQVSAVAAQESRTLRLGDQPSPPAKVDMMAWLAGRWTGEGMGGLNDEIWSDPRDGVMMGMFRHLKQDKVVFYEFLMLVEEKGTVVLKLKHFNPDFSGWEEKTATVNFPLVKVEERAVHFNGLSFIREAADTLRIYLALRDSKTGQTREEVFVMKRNH